jgi:hypothetical protein
LLDDEADRLASGLRLLTLNSSQADSRQPGLSRPKGRMLGGASRQGGADKFGGMRKTLSDARNRLISFKTAK